MTNESRGKGRRRVTINRTTQHQHNRHQITRDGHQGKSPDAITVLTGLLLKTQTSPPSKFRSSAVPLFPINGLIGLIAWLSCTNVCPLPNLQICSHMLIPCRLAVDFQCSVRKWMSTIESNVLVSGLWSGCCTAEFIWNIEMRTMTMMSQCTMLLSP